MIPKSLIRMVGTATLYGFIKIAAKEIACIIECEESSIYVYYSSIPPGSLFQIHRHPRLLKLRMFCIATYT
jgi:hypothetical protein